MMEHTNNRRPRRRSTISHVSDYQQPHSNSYDGQYGASYNNATVGFQNANDYQDNYQQTHNYHSENGDMNNKQWHEGHRGTTDRQRMHKRTSEPQVSDWTATPDQDAVKKIERRVVDEMRVATQNMQSRHRDNMTMRPVENMRPRRRSSMPMVSDWVLEQRRSHDYDNPEKVHCTAATRNPYVPRHSELRKEAYIHESMDDYFLNKNVREMIKGSDGGGNETRKGMGRKTPRQMSSEPVMSSQEKRHHERIVEDTDTSKVDRLLLATKDAFDKFMDGFNKEQEETLQEAQTRDDQLLQATKSVIDKIKSGFTEKQEGQHASQQQQDDSSTTTNNDENLLQVTKNALGKFIRNISEDQRNNMSQNNTSSNGGRWTSRFQGFVREDSFTAKMFQRLGQ